MLNKILYVVAILLFLPGVIWFGQGIGLIKGSFMTSETRWAVTGAIMIVVAAGIFWFARTRSAR